MVNLPAKTLLLALLSAAAVRAEPGDSGRNAFLQRQAYEEMQRVSSQVDVLEGNLQQLGERIGRIERGGGEIGQLKADIEALKSDLNRLRREMQDQRRAIVADIVARINKAQPVVAPQPVRPPAPSGPVGEYIVQPHDNLSLIAQAFGTTVGKIKELNGLRSDNLKVGQKLIVPDVNAKKRRR